MKIYSGILGFAIGCVLGNLLSKYLMRRQAHTIQEQAKKAEMLITKCECQIKACTDFMAVLKEEREKYNENHT